MILVWSFCHPERSRGIAAERFILPPAFQASRFALISFGGLRTGSPLRSLALAPVGMT